MHHLFSNYIFAWVAWCHSFWPLDSTTFNFSSMSKQIELIISLGIPMVDHHKFQIFASVACNILWFYRYKAFHYGVSFDAHSVSVHINKSLLSISKLGTPSL
jgi:hypothetical protein